MEACAGGADNRGGFCRAGDVRSTPCGRENLSAGLTRGGFLHPVEMAATVDFFMSCEVENFSAFCGGGEAVVRMLGIQKKMDFRGWETLFNCFAHAGVR